MARKKVQKELTPEQKLEEARMRALRDVEEHVQYQNIPTYVFNVGDHVSYGAMKDAVVEEVLYDGKAYLLRCVATENNYGHPFDRETYCGAMWVNVRDFSRVEDTHFTNDSGLKLNFCNQTIESLLHKYYFFGVDMAPDYQRDFVWSSEDKEYLIDSIFLGIDIGKFVFVSRPDEKWHEDRLSYEILDGKQRLNALVEFFEDRLPYKGHTFSQLSWKDRYTFREHVVSVADVRNAAKKDILISFLNLNRGGRVMDKSQIEKVEHMLEELNAGM